MINVLVNQSTNELERPKMVVTLVRNPIHPCVTRDTSIMSSDVMLKMWSNLRTRPEARGAPRL